MSSHPKYIIYKGKRYILHSAHTNHNTAHKVAESIKEQGHKAVLKKDKEKILLYYYETKALPNTRRG